MVCMNLKETFEKYVQSCQNADLEGLFSTVTDDESVLFLNASGNIIDTREGYYRFHEEWFNDTGWEMPVELIDICEGTDYGYTVAVFHYKEKTPVGMYNLDSYFTLIFKRENGEWRVVADVCTPIKRTLAEGDVTCTWEQYYLFDTMKTRRTVRRFKPDPVPEGHILKILDAARYAPTARNKQPWKFLVIRDKEKLTSLKEKAIEWFTATYGKDKPEKERDTFKEAVTRMAEGAFSAPVYVVVLVDSQEAIPEYILYDGALAAGYLMIAAKALGYGTGFFTRLFPEGKIKEFLGIPDRYKVICVTPLGVPEEVKDSEEVPKKDLEGFVVFEEFKEEEKM